MGLGLDSIGGGGQFKQAIQKIIEVESQPIKNLNIKKTKEDSRLKLFQEFKSKFSKIDKSIADLSNFKKFRELKATLGEEGNQLVDVTIDKDQAEPGEYLIEISEIASRKSIISNGFQSQNEPFLGIGIVTVTLKNGDQKEIIIDEDHASLHGVASIINQDQDVGVRAAVIKDDSTPDTPWKLLITSKKDGELNQIDFPEFYFLEDSIEFYVDDQHDASNAQINIDGFSIELKSNDANDFLPGVNLHIKQANPDHPFKLKITEDIEKIGGKVKAFTEELNQILQFIIEQNTIDEHSDTSSTFAGDISLQNIEYRIRNLIHQKYQFTNENQNEEGNEKFLYLNQIGIEFDKKGFIEFKEEKFNKILENDFDLISNTICGKNGFTKQAQNLLRSYSQAGSGMLSIKEQGLRSKIKEMDRQIEEKTMALQKKKEALISKFSKLESTMASLQQQQQYLSTSLSAGGGGGNLVSQLMGG